MDLPIAGLKVVLGPGLVYGFAGFGALCEFERRSIPVAAVAGANTGALAAAMWAVGGELELATRVAAHLPWDDYFAGRDLGASDPLLGALSVLTRNLEFADCARRISVFSVDLECGAPVVFESGSLARAVRCSMAIPQVFEPLAEGGRRYCDGGLARAALRRAAGEWEGPVVAFWPKAELRYDPGASPRERAAAYAARAWGEAPFAPATVVEVSGPASHPLDFARALDWIEAGRRAAAAWLTEARPAGNGGGAR